MLLFELSIKTSRFKDNADAIELINRANCRHSHIIVLHNFKREVYDGKTIWRKIIEKMGKEKAENALNTFQGLFHGLTSMFPTYMHMVRVLIFIFYGTIYSI